jgi:two-component system nitrogen regulation response regulator GlnG
LEGISTLLSRHLRAYFAAHHDHLPPEGLYHRIWDEVERALFDETLRLVGGNHLKASQILGIHRNTLSRKLTRKAG